MADVFAPQPVKTKVAGDVVVNINAGQTIALSASTAVAGKFGIDQTTPGTTNGVSVTNTSLAVTGAFFQATQPVSIGTAVAVTGAFFQATQPVSLAGTQVVNLTQVGGVAVTTGSGASTTGT